MAISPKRVGSAILKFILVVAGLLACARVLVYFGEMVPMIEEVGPSVTTDALTTTPIRFAQTDFYGYPTRVDAELGRLTVPARRDSVTDLTLSLRFVKLPTTSDSPGPPVVYLAGGPGGSGVNTASGDRFRFFMKLREAGDVIALDQRGTPSSEPFPRCTAEYSFPLDRVVGEVEMSEAKAPALAACWREWEEQFHPDAFNTVENAHDLESLRIALGAEQLNLVGLSYGTHLALTYMRLYPDRVGRAILAGVEGLDHTYKSPAVVDSLVYAVDRYLADEMGWDGFVDDILLGLDRLERERPVVSVTPQGGDESMDVALGPIDLKQAVHFGLGERDDFKRAARRVRAIAQGDDMLLANYALRLRQGGSAWVMPLSMDCASGVSDERRERIARESESALIGDVANLDLTTTCPFWPVSDLGEEFRRPLQSDIPMMAVSGTLDLRTPPSNAEEVLLGFSNSGHLIIEGAGHGDDLLRSSRQIAEAMVRFLVDGDSGRERIVL